MIDIISFSTNKTLYSHCKQINRNISKSLIHGGIRSNAFNYFKDVFKSTKRLNNKYLLVYNTSPKNILVSFLQKLNGKKILFQLHDPKPHSGALNPIIYILNFIQLLISNKILVFNKNLISQTKSLYPFVDLSKIHVTSHGLPKFSYEKQTNDLNEIKIGFFGRLMPYKNFKSFLKFSKKYPQHQYFIIGDGYEGYINEINDLNLIYINGFIDNDRYYSYMLEMDYIFAVYKDVSYSGIVNDAICLKKKIIVSDEVQRLFNNNNCILFSENLILEKSDVNPFELNFKNGWNEYSSKIIEIINS